MISCLLVSSLCAFLAACGGSTGQSAAGNSSSAESSDPSAESSEDSASEETSREPQRWSIGTTQSGAWYYVGAAIATVVSPKTESKGLEIASEAANGSIDNLRRLNSGELALGMANNVNLDEELAGGTVQAENLCYIMPVYTNYIHTLVSTNKGWNTMAEMMEGAKAAKSSVGVGEPGSGYYVLWEQMLDVFDMTMDDISQERISITECVDLMIDGDLDILEISGGLYNTQVNQIISSIKEGVVLLPWTSEEIDKFVSKSQYYFETEIPGGVYECAPEAIKTIGFKPMLYCRADLDEDLVYELTKAMCESTDEMGDIYEPCYDITAENAVLMKDVYESQGVPMHPGALRYFQELGLL